MTKNSESEKVLRYSIKKYSVGAVSVVVGAFIFFGGSALASEKDVAKDEKVELKANNIEEKKVETTQGESATPKASDQKENSTPKIDDKEKVAEVDNKNVAEKVDNNEVRPEEVSENTNLAAKENRAVNSQPRSVASEEVDSATTDRASNSSTEGASTTDRASNSSTEGASTTEDRASNSSTEASSTTDRASNSSTEGASTTEDRASNSSTEASSTTDRASNDEGIKKIPLTEEIAEKIKAGLIRLEGNKVDPSLIESDVLINNENGDSNIEKDNDGDTLLTNKELYVYEKDGKQYIGYNSHPYLKDTDGDGITDDKEKEGEVLKWNVSDRDLAMFQELAYREDSYINEVLDETRKDITLYKNRQEYRMMNKELAPYWKVKKTYHDNNGFDAVLFETKSKFPYLKDGAAQVLAIRGTAGVGGDTTADVALWFGKKPKQAGTVEEIIKNYALGQENLTNLYITGHSLGGYLTQIAFTHAYQLMKEKKGATTEEQAKFDNFYNNVLKRAVTFNAPRIRTNVFESQEFWDKGLYSTELAKAGKIKHYVVDNDSVVGKYYNDKETLTSIGTSAEGHGSRSYFEKRVNDFDYFKVGERNTMDGAGYRDPKVSETTPIEVENPITVLAGGKLSEATLKEKLKLNAGDTLKLGDLANITEFSTTDFGTYVLPLLVTHKNDATEKKYVEINVSPNWFFFDNELNASKNKLKEQVDLKHKTQRTLSDYNAAKLSLEEEVRKLDSFRTNFDETANTQAEINAKKEQIAELLAQYNDAIEGLADIEKYKLEVIKVQGGKIPTNEVDANNKVTEIVTETKLDVPTSAVLTELAKDEKNKNLVLLDKEPTYKDEEADDAIYHVGRIYVSEVGKLIAHDEDGTKEIPYTIKVVDNKQVVSYEAPQSKYTYYTNGNTGKVLSSSEVLNGDARFKNLDVYPKYKGVKLRFKLTENDNTVTYLLKDIDAKYKSDDVNDYFGDVKDEIVTDREFDDYVLVDYKDNKLGGDIKDYKAVESELTNEERNSLKEDDHNKVFITINLHKVGNLHIKTNGVDKVTPYLAINNEEVPRVFYTIPRENNVVYFINENGTKKVVEAGDVYLEGDARIRDTYIDAVEKTTRYFIEGTTIKIRTSEKGEKKPYLAAVNYNDEVYYHSKTEPMDENGVTTQYFKKAGSVSIHFISTTGEELDGIVGKDENYVLQDVKAGTSYDFANNERLHPDTLEAVPRKFKRVTEAGTITTKDGKVLSYNEHGNITSDGYAPDAGEVVSGKNLIVTYVYKEEVGGITVGYYTVDGKPLSGTATGIYNKNEVAEKEVVVMNGKEIKDVPYGTPYDATLLRATTITTKDGDKYYYVRKDNLVDEKGEILKEGNLEVKYYYEKGGSVVINYISTTGEKLKDEQIGQDSNGDMRDVKPGTAYNFENDEHMRKAVININGRVFQIVTEDGVVQKDGTSLNYNDKGYVTSDGYAPEAGTIQSGKTLNLTYVYKELLGGIKVAYYDSSSYDSISGTTTGIDKHEVNEEEIIVEDVSMGTPYDATKLRAETITTKKGDKYYYLRTGVDIIEAGKVSSDDMTIIPYFYEKAGSVVVNYISTTGEAILSEKVAADESGNVLEKQARPGTKYDVSSDSYKLATIVKDGKLYKLAESGTTTSTNVEKLRYADGKVVSTATGVVESKNRKYTTAESGQVESGKTLNITYVYEEVPVPEPKVVREKIPFTTVYVAAPEKDYGVDSETPGADGEKVTTTTYTLDESTKQFVGKSTESATLMQPKIVRKGTKQKVEKVTSDVEVKYIADENVEANERTSQQGRAKVTTTTTTYTLNPADGTVTPKEEVVVENGAPTIITVGTKAKEERTTLATVYKADDSREVDTPDVVEEGEDRVVTTTYKLDEATGNITSETTTTKDGKAKVVTKGTKAKVVTEELDFTTTYVANPNAPLGELEEVVAGKKGSKVTTTTYTLDKANGKITENDPQVVTTEPTIRIVKVGTKIKEEVIPFKTIYIADPTKDVTSEVIVQNGKNKVVITAYKLDTTNGKVSEEISTVDGEDRIVIKGTKSKIDVETSPIEKKYVEDATAELNSSRIVKHGTAKTTATITTYTLDVKTGKVTPSSRVEVTEGTVDEIAIGTKPKVEKVNVDFGTNYVADNTLNFGETKEKAGELGEKEVTTTYKLVGDKAVVDKETTAQTKAPVAKVVKVGTKPKVETTTLPTIYKADDQKDYGTPDVVEEGEDRVVTTTYELDTATGNITPKTMTTKEGRAKVITKGTKAKVETTTLPTIYKADDQKDYGTPDVVEEGEDKVVTTTYKLDPTTGNITPETTTKDGKPKVVKVGTKPKVEVTTEPIAVTYEEDKNAEAGSQVTADEGKAKTITKTTTYTLNTQDGTVSASDNTVVEAGKPKVVKVGTKQTIDVVTSPIEKTYVEDKNAELNSKHTVKQGTAKVTATITTYTLNVQDGTVMPTTRTEVTEGTPDEIAVGTKSTTSKKAVAFETNYVAAPTLNYGETKEVAAGVLGEETVTTTYKLVGDHAVKDKETTAQTKAPVARVVAVGTKPKVEVTTEPIVVTYEEDKDAEAGSQVTTDEGKAKTTTKTTTYTLNAQNGTVSASDNTVVEDGKPKVVKVGTKAKVETTVLPTIYKADDSKEVNTPDVVEEGEDRVVTTTYELDTATGNITPKTTTTKEGRAKVITKGTKSKVVTEELNFTTTYVANPEAEAGEQEEVTAGQKGKKVTTTTYTLDKANGKVTENVPQVETTNPTTRTVKVGTKAKVEKEKISFKVRYEADRRLKFGEKIATLGKDGEKVTITTYKVDPKTGELSKTPTTTITEALDVVVSIGNIEKVEGNIPVTTIYIEDKTLLRGESSTKEGEVGRKELIKTYKLDNKGNLIEPTLTEKILIDMKPTIVRYGTKVEVAPSQEALPEYPLDQVPTYSEVPRVAPSQEALPEYPLDQVPTYSEVPNYAPIQQELPYYNIPTNNSEVPTTLEKTSKIKVGKELPKTKATKVRGIEILLLVLLAVGLRKKAEDKSSY